MSELPRMKTIGEIAEVFGIAKHFVRQTVLNEHVPHVKAGKKYLVNVERFAEYLNTGEKQTGTNLKGIRE